MTIAFFAFALVGLTLIKAVQEREFKDAPKQRAVVFKFGKISFGWASKK